MNSLNLKKLAKKALYVRQETFEQSVRAGKGHIGGTFSCADILVVLYYGGILNFNPKKLDDPNRDRFILSKGHACLALYAIFYDMGILSKKRYLSYGENGGLGGQLDMTIPGVDFNTGSLGHAIGVGAGMALAAKKSKKDFRAVALIGDAELFEGSMWEAIIFATEQKLNNLIVIIDRNKLSVTSVIEDDESLYLNFKEKVKNFGWQYLEFDGHDMKAIISGLKKAKQAKGPVMIIARTIKGKGVSLMENNHSWHQGIPSQEAVAEVRKELKIK